MFKSFPSFRWAWVAGVFFLVGACSAQSETGNPGKDAGNVGTGGSGGAAPGSGGTTGSGGAPASGGASGAVDAPQDLPGHDTAPADLAQGEGGPIATASNCAEAHYPVCLDFEKLPDAAWTGITATNVQMGKAAHGMAAFHGPPNSSLSITNLGTITNVAWGRFYLHMTPKAPVGHGAMVMMFDQPGRGGNWYEVGFEFNALQGNWHGGGGEKYMRTKQLLQDKWTCVEFFMDGANAMPVQLWMDGVPVVYSDVAKTPTVAKTVKFSVFSIGLTPYHGYSTTAYEGNANPMTDMWIDDIALDTQRIGCIAGP